MLIKSLLLVIPSRHGFVRAEIAVAISEWQKDANPPAKLAGISIVGGITTPSFARDVGANIFLESGMSHVLWIDDDMAPRYAQIRALVQKALILKSYFLSAGYCLRTEKPTLAGALLNDPAEGGLVEERGVAEMRFVGFGCVLIAREVFEKTAPLCKTYQLPVMGAKTAYFHPDSPGEAEDMAFCRRAREVGFTIHADLSNIIDHVGTTKFPLGRQNA